MKRLTAVLFAVASALYAPAPVLAIGDLALNCDGDVPVEWRRPGGFCEQESSGKSLSPPGSQNVCPDLVFAGLADEKLAAGERIRVAAVINPCCPVATGYDLDDGVNGLLLAAVDPCNPCPAMFHELLDGLPAGDRLLAAC